MLVIAREGIRKSRGGFVIAREGVRYSRGTEFFGSHLPSLPSQVVRICSDEYVCISTESISLMGGGLCQGCHGYLHTLADYPRHRLAPGPKLILLEQVYW